MPGTKLDLMPVHWNWDFLIWTIYGYRKAMPEWNWTLNFRSDDHTFATTYRLWYDVWLEKKGLVRTKLDLVPINRTSQTGTFDQTTPRSQRRTGIWGRTITKRSCQDETGLDACIVLPSIESRMITEDQFTFVWLWRNATFVALGLGHVASRKLSSNLKGSRCPAALELFSNRTKIWPHERKWLSRYQPMIIPFYWAS